MKLKTRIAFVSMLLAITISLTACAGSRKAYDTAAAAEAPMAAPYPNAEMAVAEEMGVNYSASQTAESFAPIAESAAGDASMRKIVYNANMDVTSDDPSAALEIIIEKAKALGGYLSGSYTTTDELGAYRCTATLKVPAEQLETLVSAAKEIGKVDSYELLSDDISLSYYDIEARLASAKAEEAQLIEILDKCETVEEVLAVRESLAAVRSDIESYQGQINLWDNLVAYATLDLTVRRTQRAVVEGDAEPIAIWKSSDVWKKMRLGFVNGARFVVNAVGAIGIFLAYVALPGAVIAAVVIGLIALNKKLKPAREKRREQRRLAREEKKAQKLQKKNE